MKNLKIELQKNALTNAPEMILTFGGGGETAKIRLTISEQDFESINNNDYYREYTALCSDNKSDDVSEQQNKKIITEIAYFQHSSFTFNDGQNMGIPSPNKNHKITWFYLKKSGKGKIRCFSEFEAKKVADYLSALTLNGKNCFKNVQIICCDNDSCENEVADTSQYSPNIPEVEKDNLVNYEPSYCLPFDIIGYFNY